VHRLHRMVRVHELAAPLPVFLRKFPDRRHDENVDPRRVPSGSGRVSG
jgi:hypothetical protein